MSRYYPAVALLALAVLLVGCLFSAGTASVGAQGVGVDFQPLMLNPGESATLFIRAFCTEYTIPFARTFPSLGTPADPVAINVLRYALEKRYTETEPYQVQLALWRATVGRWVTGEPRVIAEEIYDNALRMAPPPAPPSGVPTLTEAVQSGTLKVVYQNWAPVTNVPNANPPWLGSGEMVVSNPGPLPVVVALPHGILLNPQGGAQKMVLYFVRVQLQATATPTASTTPVATMTGAPTPTRTPAPRATPRLPRSGLDQPDDPGYLLAVLGSLAFIGGVAADIYRRRVRRF